MGNVVYRCLMGAEGVSACKKETAQGVCSFLAFLLAETPGTSTATFDETAVCIIFCSFLF